MQNKVVYKYIRQPKYYKAFHCMGGSCPVSCCHRWRIDYTKAEYEKLKNAECSEYLHQLIDNSFSPHENFFIIKLNEERKCPFHNEEGLCSIQKELGEEYLSYTCTSYPRKAIYYDNTLVRSCTTSCPRVLSMICQDDESMTLEFGSYQEGENKIVTVDSQQKIKSNPALKYRSVLFDFFYEILSDKTHSIETSIALAAMAAQKLDEFIKQRKYHLIPEIVEALKSQLDRPEQIERLEMIKPNLSLKANFSAGLLYKSNNTEIFKTVFENDIPSEEKYNKGWEIFKEHFNGTDNYLRNIALNLFITNYLPFKNSDYSLFDNFSYFVAEFAVIKLLIPAVAVHYSPVEKQVFDAIAYVDRSFTHSDSKMKFVLNYLKDFKCTTPAYLLGIIK
ncbi:MAG: flagellin lysine-N-methylase [Oscillospiraceae bacterium]|nr:flagellin lysine-N-methylase [Oscillospiraceae bacterium]